MKHNTIHSNTLTTSVQTNTTTNGATVAAYTFEAYFHQMWVPEKVTNPPSGILMYDNMKATTATLTRYVAPEETRTPAQMSLGASVYSGTTISQSLRWSSSNTSIATVNTSTGAVTGVSPGTVTITVRDSALYYSKQYTLTVTQLPEGTYFLKNKETEAYADIESQTMANGTRIHQWELHGGNTQRWIFTHLGDGNYSIKSANAATPSYLGVINDSSGLDVDIVLRSGSVTNGMKWKIQKEDEYYKIISKCGENDDLVLAVG